VIIQSTAFYRCSHITLALAMYQVIHVPSKIIEPLISISLCLLQLKIFSFQNLNHHELALFFFLVWYMAKVLPPPKSNGVAPKFLFKFFVDV
jgi:hypothetical protein